MKYFNVYDKMTRSITDLTSMGEAPLEENTARHYTMYNSNVTLPRHFLPVKEISLNIYLPCLLLVMIITKSHFMIHMTKI